MSPLRTWSLRSLRARLLRTQPLRAQPLRRFSLRVRLLLITTALLLTGLSLISALLSDHLERYQLDRIDDTLRSFTDLASHASLTPPPELETAGEVFGPALDLLGAPYLVYLDAEGDMTRDLRSSGLDGATLPTLDELRAVPADGEIVDLPGAASSEGDADSAGWRAVARPTAGWDGTVIAAAPLTESDATVDALRRSSILSGGALLALLTAVGWLAIGHGLGPLRQIEHTAAAIAGGDLTRRVPDLAPPETEIGHLAGSLNTMLGQLEQAFADRAASETRMRDFVWDVSHELRTPLFGIKGSSELYQMGGMPARTDVDEAMRRINREATRLAALTEDLLVLAQLDEAPDQLDRTPMDLRTLASDGRLDVRALDPTRPVELTGPGGNGPPGPAAVPADEARLRQVVTNLVGNAVAHTPPGAPVRIGVGTVGDRAVLEVADQGPGMSVEQASRVFDRFYRADRSRNRQGGAGAGLGLAIVRSIARAHGGDIELETGLGRGTCFRLALPLSPPPPT